MPEITYAEALAPLENILAQVERPGEFFATGTVETSLPLFEVDGMGLLSFPVPPEQCGRIIDSRNLDMTHVTERKGRLQTLVCTKTLGYYDRACRQYEQDFADMKRLLALPSADAESSRSEAKRLRCAVNPVQSLEPRIGESLFVKIFDNRKQFR